MVPEGATLVVHCSGSELLLGSSLGKLQLGRGVSLEFNECILSTFATSTFLVLWSLGGGSGSRGGGGARPWVWCIGRRTPLLPAPYNMLVPVTQACIETCLKGRFSMLL